MNKKQLILLTISLALILFPSKVMASNAGASKCLNHVNIEWKDGNDNTISDPTEVTTDRLKVVVTATKGEWEVYFGHPEGIDSSDELFDDDGKFKYKQDFKSLGDDNKYTKTINLRNDTKDYVVLFVNLKKQMKVDGATCKAGNYVIEGNKIKISNNGTGKWRTYRISKYDPDIANGVNSSKPACARMVKGQYNKGGTSSERDICYNETTKKTDDTCARLSDYQIKMQNYFPYCFSDTDNANLEFDGKFINEVKQKFIIYYNDVTSIKFSTKAEVNEYNSRLTALAASTDWVEKSVSGNKESEWKTSVGSLSCDTSLSTETTKKYYAEKTVLNNSYCDVKCTEEFTTTYTPPVASKAGLCFTYQVTVKSKVNCITEQKSTDVWPKVRVRGCKYKAVCEDSTDQAGPNEEFDSCINECDGGKYSQSCINKCYKEVYGSTKKSSSKNKTLKTSNNTFAKVKFLANDNDPYYTYTDDNDHDHNLNDLCSTWKKLEKNLQLCAEGFKEAKDTDPLGAYKNRTKGGFYWKTTADKAKNENTTHSVGGNRTGAHSVINSIKRAAPYYLRSVEATKVLLKSLFGYGHYFNRTYNIDNEGIKRQSSTKYKCKEDCWFKKKNEGSCISSVSDARKIYSDEINNKESQIEKCSTTAAELCSTTEATFEIGASNVTKKDNDEGKDFSNSNKTDNGDDIICAKKSQSNLLNDIFAKLPEDTNTNSRCDNGVNGKCYGTPYNDHEYKTTITFPGAWINLKTGEVKYTNNNLEDKGYDLEKYKYCTMYNSKNVNSSWWNWRVEQNRDTSKIPSVEDYNIHANVKSFGKFNWSLDFKCFYALNDWGYCPPSDPNYPCDNNKECTGASCTSASNIDIRFVREDKKLFAGRKYGSTGSSNDSGNQIGFNWTKDAQDTTLNHATAKGYDINPYEYGKSIMDSNNTENVYKEQADVIISLTPTTAKSIKAKKYEISQFDKNGKWTKDKNIPMLNYYQSKVLQELGADVVKINYKRGYNYE